MKKDSATQLVLLNILKSSPGLLLTGMILSFILSGLIQTFYYSNYLFTEKFGTYAIGFGMAVTAAILVQFCRIAFGVTGAYDFGKGNILKAIFGLGFSLALTVWQSFEVSHIASSFSNDPTLQSKYQMILQLIVWAGFALELRLGITVAGTIEEATPASTQENTDTPVEPGPREEHPKFSQNGKAIPATLGKG